MAWSVFFVVCTLTVCVFDDVCVSVRVCFFGTLIVSVTKQCGYDVLIYLFVSSKLQTFIMILKRIVGRITGCYLSVYAKKRMCIVCCV